MKQTRNYHKRSRVPEEPPSTAAATAGTPPMPLISSSTTVRPSSASDRATPVHPNLILPVPIYTPVDHTKKSHARKQPAGHIPRPRNAFILFRCNFVDQDKIPSSVERDHRNISRIVGSLWRKMSDAEKEPWVRMADDEKRAHFLAYPGYRFSRALTASARPIATRRKRDDTASSRDSLSPKLYGSIPEPASDPSHFSPPGHDASRPASCPPAPIPTAISETLDSFPEPIINRDDLARRPSRVMLSESAGYENFYSGFNDIHPPAGYTMKDTDRMDQYISHEIESYRSEAQPGGPRLNAIRLPMPGVDHPSELDIFDTWDEWHAAHRQQVNTPPGKEPSQDALEYSSLIMADSIDLDLSPTLPPLPLLETPEEDSEREYYYPPATSPIERKNSFYSPRSGTWKLPLPIMSSNPASGTCFNSISHIDSSISLHDNIFDGELRYPDADQLSGRTRASSSWSFDTPPSNGSSAHVHEHQLHDYEANKEHTGPWRSSLRRAETVPSALSSQGTHSD